MTDLEKHVNRPGRAKQVKRVREKIKELGKALSVENFNLDPIMKAIGAVGTSTEKYFKLEMFLFFNYI